MRDGITIVNSAIVEISPSHQRRKLPPRLTPVPIFSLPRGVASDLDCRLAPALASLFARGLVLAPVPEFVLGLARELAGEFVPDLGRGLASGFASEFAPRLASDLVSELVSGDASELDSELG